jgi:hypothetical protein
LAGDYARGVRLLSELFVSTKMPTFIYNQARCFEQNRRYEDAISRFREYLRVAKDISGIELADTNKHIAECEGLLAAERPSPVPASPVAQPVPASPVAQPVPATEAGSVAVRQPPPAAGSSGLRTGGIATASVGGAALIAGIVFNLKSNSLARDIKKTDGFTSDKESDRKTYATLGWVGYGVGATCIATGAILYLLAQRSENNATVAFLPLLATGQAGAALRGSF